MAKVMPKKTAAPRRTRALPGSPRLVAIGGSAGGFESLKRLVAELGPEFPVPILATLHLDPDRHSHAVQLLTPHTRMRIQQAVSGIRPRPGTLYLAPPDRHLEVRDGRIALTRSARVRFSRPSIDTMFASAAKAYGPRLLAVVLSGAGEDGATGIRAVKAAGGSALVEDPSTAEHPGMPSAAAATGCVDAALPAARLGPYLQVVATGARIQVTRAEWSTAANILRNRLGADFSGYRPDTLHRRLEGRIAATGTRTARRYLALLRRDPHELESLRSALLVKMSSFRRDPALWPVLQKELARHLRSNPKRPVRIWSAGCATGEEAYSLAIAGMALRPAGGLKVFGTDLDEPALAQARAGVYPVSALSALSPAEIRHSFRGQGPERRVAAEVRRHVVFGRHDLQSDPPLADMDVVACRNVLIYLMPAERQTVLRALASALRPGGLLFLGTTEGTPLPGDGFVRVSPRVPIFRRVDGPRSKPAVVPRPARRSQGKVLQVAASGQPVIVAVDAHGRVTVWNRAAERVLGVTPQQALRHRLPQLLRKQPELESTLAGILSTGTRRRLPPMLIPTPDGVRTLRFEGTPLPGATGVMLVGTVTVARRGAKGRKTTTTELDALMQAQQTMNEQLQSRNEELETVNEELQSLNDEIQVQADDARRATVFLAAALDSGPDIVVGCDRKGLVSHWGQPAVRRFGLSTDQALGKDLLALVPSLDKPPLRRLLHATSGPARAHKPKTVQVAPGWRATVIPTIDREGRRHGCLVRFADTKT